MKKCEVLNDTVIQVLKGSIVLVSDRQYELARRVLKPIELKEKDTEVSVSIPVKETRKKKK